jgi:hypothetical protein
MFPVQFFSIAALATAAFTIYPNQQSFNGMERTNTGGRKFQRPTVTLAVRRLIARRWRLEVRKPAQ